jgi:NAD(P)-dependent dehydrogenase (short-subunit alcohol dehydrogenase family)
MSDSDVSPFSLVQKAATIPLLRRSAAGGLMPLLVRGGSALMDTLGIPGGKETNPLPKKEDPNAHGFLATSTNAPTNTKTKWRWLLPVAAVVAPVSCIYVVYPISMLVLFRISETISWLRLFEHSHYCRTAGNNSMNHCLALYGIHAVQLGSIAAMLAYLKKLYPHWKSMSRFIATIFFLSIGAFKLCVDDIYLYRPPPPHLALLKGKVAVVSGANRGIGLATAQALAERGAHVVLTCRSLATCQPAMAQINQHPPTMEAGGSASVSVLELSSLESAYNLTKQLERQYPSIHYVFCNAGTTPQYQLTREGLEDAFGGMHLAHMAVVLGLLPSLRKAASETGEPSRIIMVSSEMAINAAIGVFGTEPLFRDTSGDDFADIHGEITRGDGTFGNSLPAYARAKLCNVLFALEINRRLATNNELVIAHAVHTGAVHTASSRTSIQKIFSGVPGLSTLVGHVYFPLLWRHVNGGARVLLCAALSHEDYILRGGQYLDALCHPFLPPETQLHDEDFSLVDNDNIQPDTISFGPWTISKDPIQALMLADKKWSDRLWNVSISLLENSPARDVVPLAPPKRPVHG